MHERPKYMGKNMPVPAARIAVGLEPSGASNSGGFII